MSVVTSGAVVVWAQFWWFGAPPVPLFYVWLSVSVCLCLCVCVSVCAYVCVCVFLSLSLFLSLCLSLSLSLSLHVSVSVSLCLCLWLGLSLSLSLSLLFCLHIGRRRLVGTSCRPADTGTIAILETLSRVETNASTLYILMRTPVIEPYQPQATQRLVSPSHDRCSAPVQLSDSELLLLSSEMEGINLSSANP